jgi:hypothetical protein
MNGRFLPDRGRKRNALNLLLCLAAVVGITGGGYQVWAVLAARHAINQACAGLVPAGEVTDLPLAGGRINHNANSINLNTFSGNCQLFSTEAGSAYHTSTGERMFFSAYVSIEPGSTVTRTDDAFDELTDQYFHAYLDAPLGGGISGIVTDSGVGVRLPCGSGVVVNGSDVENVVASAVSETSGAGTSNSNGGMSQSTRDKLASIAVATANNAAEKLGCKHRLPAAPTAVPGVESKLITAASATGTCAWYGKARAGLDDGSGWMPDRAVETRTDSDVWKEKCGLAMSQDAAAATWRKYHGKKGYTYLREVPEKPAEWWASFESFFGAPAKGVVAGSDETPIKQGTAGVLTRTNTWWASSVCHGKPAVHTLTLGYPYSIGATRRFEPLFRAYVKDVAARRGCTHLTFPKSSDIAGA